MISNLLHHSLHKSVAKSEGSWGKHIGDGWVDCRIIFVVVSIGHGEDIQLSHVVCTENYWQPFIVCYVLEKWNLKISLSFLFCSLPVVQQWGSSLPLDTASHHPSEGWGMPDLLPACCVLSPILCGTLSGQAAHLHESHLKPDSFNSLRFIVPSLNSWQ